VEDVPLGADIAEGCHECGEFVDVGFGKDEGRVLVVGAALGREDAETPNGTPLPIGSSELGTIQDVGREARKVGRDHLFDVVFDAIKGDWVGLCFGGEVDGNMGTLDHRLQREIVGVVAGLEIKVIQVGLLDSLLLSQEAMLAAWVGGGTNIVTGCGGG